MKNEYLNYWDPIEEGTDFDLEFSARMSHSVEFEFWIEDITKNG